MKQSVVLIAVLAVVSGIQYDGLRVKYGWSDTNIDVDKFFTIPRTIKDAETAGWQKTERPPGPMQELVLYCNEGRGVCPLYDPSGFIAGLQVALPVDEYQSSAYNPETKLVRWNAPAMGDNPPREYWTATQFFVSEEDLKADAGPTEKNGATLQNGGVWVTGLDGKLMKIPTAEKDIAETTAFKKQRCVPNMGMHYYYNMTPELKCEDTLPWFVLTNDGEMVGSGFSVYGRLSKSTYRDWFERPELTRDLARVALPHAPECVLDWASDYGVVSLHIYYIDNPWTIECGSDALEADIKSIFTD